METFNYQNQLQKFIDTKQLVQVYFYGNLHEFRVAYIIGATKDFLTLLEVNDGLAFDGITIHRMDRGHVIKSDTPYIEQLTKLINPQALYEQGIKNVEGIKDYTFDGFIAGLENTKTIVEIMNEEDNAMVGRILGHDGAMLSVNDFSVEKDGGFSHSYINLESVTTISLDVPYLRIVARTLADKNL